MRIKGAIFDVDGTLLDSMPIWMEIGARYVRSLGKEPEENLGEILFPMTMKQGAAYVKETYGLDQSIPQIIEDINAIVEKYYLQEALLKPGAIEILTWLQEKNIPMTVATSTELPLIEGAFARLHLRSFFQEIFTCTQVGAGKDKPLIYQEAARFMGTDPGETWVFEDALHGLLTAKKAGFFTVGLYDAASEKQQEDLAKNADLYGENLLEILDKLKNQ